MASLFNCLSRRSCLRPRDSFKISKGGLATFRRYSLPSRETLRLRVVGVGAGRFDFLPISVHFARPSCVIEVLAVALVGVIDGHGSQKTLLVTIDRQLLLQRVKLFPKEYTLPFRIYTRLLSILLKGGFATPFFGATFRAFLRLIDNGQHGVTRFSRRLCLKLQSLCLLPFRWDIAEMYVPVFVYPLVGLGLGTYQSCEQDKTE